MGEYWKSTERYWCKFCSTFVKDTGIERRNHEASVKHQNSIQRHLRGIHKEQEREAREAQFAKKEVARLNGLVGGKLTDGRPPAAAAASSAARTAAASGPVLTPAQDRKRQAEQLAALGVVLPESLRKEVQGVGSFQVISQSEVESRGSGRTINRPMAEVLAEARQQQAKQEEEIKEEEDEPVDRKRRLEDESDGSEEEAQPRRKKWGTDIKTFPEPKTAQDDDVDLDALLSGIGKREAKIKQELQECVKEEPEQSEGKPPLSAVPEIDAPKDSTPTVVFKKRKGKR